MPNIPTQAGFKVRRNECGQLHRYDIGKNLNLFEPASPDIDAERSQKVKGNTLLFVGGLSDNFLSVPYVYWLSFYLGYNPQWALMEVQLSSSGTGWGTSNLHEDANELSKAVQYVRDRTKCACPNNSEAESYGNIVLMGHSTGCQSVLTYLSQNFNEHRAPVQGIVLQAAVSDREGLAVICQESKDVRKACEECLDITRGLESKGIDPAHLTLPRELTARLGWPGVAVSCQRFVSLLSPSSPHDPAPDDLFSSDLSDESLRKTFGSICSLARFVPYGETKPSALILLSGEDEHTPQTVDKEVLLERWGRALAHGNVALAAGSGIIAAASHNVKEDNCAVELVQRVMDYIAAIGPPLTPYTVPFVPIKHSAAE